MAKRKAKVKAVEKETATARELSEITGISYWTLLRTLSVFCYQAQPRKERSNNNCKKYYDRKEALAFIHANFRKD